VASLAALAAVVLAVAAFGAAAPNKVRNNDNAETPLPSVASRPASADFSAPLAATGAAAFDDSAAVAALA
jgi:hypothetical protein